MNAPHPNPFPLLPELALQAMGRRVVISRKARGLSQSDLAHLAWREHQSSCEVQAKKKPALGGLFTLRLSEGGGKPTCPPANATSLYACMTMNSTPTAMTGVEHAALTRLLQIASGDTAQSRRCADFLLAWWNAGQCGGFDLTALWGLGDSICQDMHAVFGYIARAQHYPDTLGLGPEFEAVVRMWRPEFLESPR